MLAGSFCKRYRAMDIFYHIGLYELLVLLNAKFADLEYQAFKVIVALVFDWATKFPKKVSQQFQDD